MFSFASLTTESNMVAINSGHKQLTDASKDEFSKWKSNLRVLLNQLRVLDTKCGDKVRAYLGNSILPENYWKPRGMVIVDLLESVDGPSLSRWRSPKDTLITGSDRREWVKAKELGFRETKTVISSIILLAKPDSPLCLVLLDASRKSKDPNFLIEASENLFKAPCMATCL